MEHATKKYPGNASWPSTMMALRFFETSVIIHPMTQCHIQEDLSLQNNSCRVSCVFVHNIKVSCASSTNSVQPHNYNVPDKLCLLPSCHLSTFHIRYSLTLTISSPTLLNSAISVHTAIILMLFSLSLNLINIDNRLHVSEHTNAVCPWPVGPGPCFPSDKKFRVVICFPEDGRLTIEAWVFVIKVSPRCSSNSNGFNNHYDVRCSNPD